MYALFDTENRSLRVASAGHPPLLLLRASGEQQRLEATGPALGLYADRDYAELDVELDPGDRVLFYSDGVFDWLPDAAASGPDRLAKALGPAAATLADLASASRADEPPQDDVTLLLLDIGPGSSRFDNGSLQELPAPALAETRFEILSASEGARTTISIRGRASWAGSAALHAESTAALDAGRALRIDLARCLNLDSTLLGTLHELCERAKAGGLEFQLQSVPPRVAELFHELGLVSVLECVTERALPLPDSLQPLRNLDDPAARNARMLRAHEALASLNERNRREFDPVVSLLKREVDVDAR